LVAPNAELLVPPVPFQFEIERKGYDLWWSKLIDLKIRSNVSSQSSVKTFSIATKSAAVSIPFYRSPPTIIQKLEFSAGRTRTSWDLRNAVLAVYEKV